MTAVPPAPRRAIAKYEPKRRRSGIALYLSGGGYRAALFHPGGLRRLNELGVLERIDTISSVSGGSVVAAYLATRIQWPLAVPVSDDEWEDQVAVPFRRLVRRNIRTWPILKRYLLPWNWLGTSPDTDALAQELRAFVDDATLPTFPRGRGSSSPLPTWRSVSTGCSSGIAGATTARATCVRILRSGSSRPLWPLRHASRRSSPL